MGRIWLLGGLWAGLLMIPSREARADDFKAVPLKARITHVQPMTGLVMWAGSANSERKDIQLEYLSLGYADVITGDGEYQWPLIDAQLNAIAARGHQAVLRFFDAEQGRPTSVPFFIKARGDYHETHRDIENQDTYFPDWSSATYRRILLDFYGKFARKYDADRRVAFLEVGFGLWSEYHNHCDCEEPG